VIRPAGIAPPGPVIGRKPQFTVVLCFHRSTRSPATYRRVSTSPRGHPLEAAFGTTQWRRQLLSGLRAALEALRVARCRRAYVDGSFVTAKEVPGDFDGCWEAEDVDPDALDPVLLDFLDIHVRHRR